MPIELPPGVDKPEEPKTEEQHERPMLVLMVKPGTQMFRWAQMEGCDIPLSLLITAAEMLKQEVVLGMMSKRAQAGAGGIRQISAAEFQRMTGRKP